ncbi:MAG: DegT/DnrJ/EryC1/StrS family aminotransferase [Gemmatimonadetes bacterium]|nr:DegT/DnrJ/EryC1/StrS family aminotransferase [Gemmatimonadota bacterium]
MTLVGVPREPGVPRRPPAREPDGWTIGRFRRQPPARSPVSLAAIAGAARSLASLRPDPRPGLGESLRLAYHADSVLLTGSGEQALELGLRAAAALVGETAPTVALPAFTCFDVASAAVGAGVRIALYDVEPHTLAPDLEALAGTLSRGARIVVATPLYGIPFDWHAVEDCAARFGAVVIEDAAQGHGARWWGRPLGTLGQISVLSFGRGKGWTGGRGGAVLFRRGARAPERLSEPTLSADRRIVLTALAQWWLGRPSWYALPASLPWLGLGETTYHEPERPAGMTRAAAGLIEHTRVLAEVEEAARQANAAELLARLPANDDVQPVRCQPGGRPGYLRLPVLFSGGLAGFARRREARRLGVAASYPSTLAAIPAVRARLTPAEARWPGAETLVRDLVTLPTHSGLTAGDRAALGRLLERYAR